MLQVRRVFLSAHKFRSSSERFSGVSGSEFGVAKTGRHVVIDHSDGLHERVADRRADETKPASFEVFAHRIRFRRSSRYLTEILPAVLSRAVIDKSPDESIETPKLLLDRQQGIGIVDGRLNLQRCLRQPSKC